jgi:hypothetical protein
MKHHVAKPAPDDILQTLREDAALKAIYRSKSLSAIDTIWGGLNNAQKDAVLKGCVKVVWLLLRRLSKEKDLG